ncbi:MAG: hypothetical protein DWQ31_13430 [Planctomycetota bacterium]|nr:MAG: hypothetical protein DWQ31_13430 [Planctomycetota bacterium]REJ97317.1 MAG: hypothetical protein DWQ35_01805 [Planctomycetota bacterium]REK26621.1 MAG: hypothetical protein DWQ42_08630 [Planctomycetota bacterium]REK48086.1 MAG: hypothetical protein DWQ46_02655 [Planctomycetota bacterium]
MFAESLQLSSDFSGEVRLFPLSDLVLFPGVVLPLHIFESRYQEMLQDAVDDDQLIAMATLLPGHEHDYYSRPPVAPIVCIGQVTAHERTESGTYNLVLVGVQPAEILHEIEPVRAFRRASVEVLRAASEASDASSDKMVDEDLAALVQQRIPAAEKLVRMYREGRLDTTKMVDVLAFHLPLPTDLKLQLLAESRTEVRVEMLVGALPATSAAEAPPAPPSDFSDN